MVRFEQLYNEYLEAGWGMQARKNGVVSRLIAGVVLATAIVATEARAQECSQILERGLFDVSQTYNDVNFSQSVFRWIQLSKFRNEQEARAASTDAGIDIVGYGSGDFKQSRDERSVRTWSESFSDKYTSDIAFRQNFQQKIVAANPNIVSAWTACVQRARATCWTQPGEDESQVLFKIRLPPSLSRQNPQPQDLQSVRSIALPSNLQAESPIEGVPLQFGGVSTFTLKRIGNNAFMGGNMVVKMSIQQPEYLCEWDVRVPKMHVPAPIIVGPTCVQQESANGFCTKCKLDAKFSNLPIGGRGAVAGECEAMRPGVPVRASFTSGTIHANGSRSTWCFQLARLGEPGEDEGLVFINRHEWHSPDGAWDEFPIASDEIRGNTTRAGKVVLRVFNQRCNNAKDTNSHLAVSSRNAKLIIEER